MNQVPWRGARLPRPNEIIEVDVLGMSATDRIALAFTVGTPDGDDVLKYALS